MAKRKVVQKKVAQSLAPKTISVGKPAPPKVVTVLGIDFEQGDNYKFGKCASKTARTSVVYNFIKVTDVDYLLWIPMGTYLDYYSVRDPHFTQQYNIVDWDTPVGATPTTGIQGAGVDYDDDGPYF